MATGAFGGQVVLVTGAGRGIGREYALFLAAHGASVVVHNRTAALAHEVVEEVGAAGGAALADAHDITTRTGARALVTAAVGRFGRLDAVVNNAGISNFRPFEDIDEDGLEAMLAVHVRAPWFVTQAAWPHLAAAGHGRVLMTISSAGLWGQVFSPHYSLAKSAMIGLVRSLAHEGRDVGIRVNALSPAGFTRMVPRLNESAWTAARAAMPAALLAPAAAALVHRDCPVSGGLFTARGSRLARVWMSENAGFSTTPEDFTLDAVLAGLGVATEKVAAVDEDEQMAAGRARILDLLAVSGPDVVADFRRTHPDGWSPG